MKTTIALTIIAALAALLPGHMLEWQRSGEAWRIVTCHFTHWTHEQFAWDVLAFSALGIGCARRNRAALTFTLLASMLTIPVAVLAFSPNIGSYRGLSGIASALFALLLTTEARRNWLVAVCALGFAGKIVLELTTEATLFVRDMGADVVSVPIAHLAGAIIGLLAGIPGSLSPRLKQTVEDLLHSRSVRRDGVVESVRGDVIGFGTIKDDGSSRTASIPDMALMNSASFHERRTPE